MLELSDLRSGYGKIRILQGVDLTVGAGEIVGLIGRNGVGKTTALRTVMGLLPASGGVVRFEGEAISTLAPHLVPHRGIGYVPQGRGMFPQLTVMESLCLGLRRDPRPEVLEDIFVRFPRLRERRRQLAGTLSGGEQQMLAIARCLLMRPRLILFDEPTEGIMPVLVRAIQDEIAAINASGVAILLVEQNIKAAARLCSRIYVMDKGRITHHEVAATYRADLDILASRMGLDRTRVTHHSPPVHA